MPLPAALLPACPQPPALRAVPCPSCRAVQPGSWWPAARGLAVPRHGPALSLLELCLAMLASPCGRTCERCCSVGAWPCPPAVSGGSHNPPRPAVPRRVNTAAIHRRFPRLQPHYLIKRIRSAAVLIRAGGVPWGQGYGAVAAVWGLAGSPCTPAVRPRRPLPAAQASWRPCLGQPESTGPARGGDGTGLGPTGPGRQGPAGGGCGCWGGSATGCGGGSGPGWALAWGTSAPWLPLSPQARGEPRGAAGLISPSDLLLPVPSQR